MKRGIRNKSTKTAFKSYFSNNGCAKKVNIKNYKKINFKNQKYHMNSKSSDISMLKDLNLINLKNIQLKARQKWIFKQRLNYNNPLKKVYRYKSGDLLTNKQLRKSNTDAP